MPSSARVVGSSAGAVHQREAQEQCAQQKDSRAQQIVVLLITPRRVVALASPAQSRRAKQWTCRIRNALRKPGLGRIFLTEIAWRL
jgi:hypothetical protein